MKKRGRPPNDNLPLIYAIDQLVRLKRMKVRPAALKVARKKQSDPKAIQVLARSLRRKYGRLKKSGELPRDLPLYEHEWVSIKEDTERRRDLDRRSRAELLEIQRLAADLGIELQDSLDAVMSRVQKLRGLLDRIDIYEEATAGQLLAFFPPKVLDEEAIGADIQSKRVMCDFLREELEILDRYLKVHSLWAKKED